ncbi:MAG TPA: DUF503 domain-containing protein [Bryobacteraceae bacterium]|jgi:hypothetical protein
MPAASIGALTLELRIEDAHSLKDKRHVVRGLKDRLRHKFNVSVAEIGSQDLWQHAVIAIVAVASDREYAEQLLNAVEKEAENFLGGALTASGVEWLA